MGQIIGLILYILSSSKVNDVILYPNDRSLFLLKAKHLGYLSIKPFPFRSVATKWDRKLFSGVLNILSTQHDAETKYFIPIRNWFGRPHDDDKIPHARGKTLLHLR